MVGIRVRALLTSCALGALAAQLSGHEVSAQQTVPAQSPGTLQPPAPGTKPAPSTQLQAGQGSAAANSTPVAAQTGADVNLDTITVTPTRTESSVVDAMAGASVITSGEIKQQQPSSIADMLQNVPGVASEVTPNDPGQSINIRGMQDFGRVNILIDGARQDYQISGHNANGTFYLDPQFVGQADIVRGPVSNIYGSGGIGGVVSFTTLESTASSTQTRNMARYSASSLGPTIRASSRRPLVRRGSVPMSISTGSFFTATAPPIGWQRKRRFPTAAARWSAVCSSSMCDRPKDSRSR